MRIVAVTADDIARGKPNYSTSCPIALALKRKFPKAKFVVVDCDMVTVDGDSFATSEEMSDFIERFDSGLEVSPVRLRMANF